MPNLDYAVIGNCAVAALVSDAARLELAYRVQHQLLPPNPPLVDGWTAAYAYAPAGMVSGDYCDVIVAPGGGPGFHFLVGDALLNDPSLYVYPGASCGSEISSSAGAPRWA